MSTGITSAELEQARALVPAWSDTDRAEELLLAIRSPAKHGIGKGDMLASMEYFSGLLRENGRLEQHEMLGALRRAAAGEEALSPEIASHVADYMEHGPPPRIGRQPNPAVRRMRFIADLYIGDRVNRYKKAILQVKPDFGRKAAEQEACLMVARECKEHGVTMSDETVLRSYKTLRKKLREWGRDEH